MRDFTKKYVCYIILEKNEVGILPRWALCPTLPYIGAKKQNVENIALGINMAYHT